MALTWKRLQGHGDDFTGDVTGSVNGTAASTVKAGAANGVTAKNAIDGNAAITVVGGSINIPDASDPQFSVDTDGDVTVKGTITVNKDSGSNAGLTLNSGTTGTMQLNMTGANPTVDVGGTGIKGTGVLKLRRETTSNGNAVQWYDGSSLKYSMGFSNEPNGSTTTPDMRTVWRMHPGNIYDADSGASLSKFVMSVGADSKIGFWDNERDFAGINIGSDGTNKGVKISDGGLVLAQKTLSNSATTAVDFATSTNFYIVLSTNTTLTASNLASQVGQSGVIVWKQDGTGGRSMTLASEMKTPRGDSISFETGANTTSILSYYIVSSAIVAVNYMGDFS